MTGTREVHVRESVNKAPVSPFVFSSILVVSKFGILVVGTLDGTEIVRGRTGKVLTKRIFCTYRLVGSTKLKYEINIRLKG